MKNCTFEKKAKKGDSRPGKIISKINLRESKTKKLFKGHSKMISKNCYCLLLPSNLHVN